MKRIFFYGSLLFGLLMPLGFLYAQTDTTSSRQGKIRFTLGLYFDNMLHYYGRRDSLQSQGFFAMAELGLGKDFYLNAAPVSIQNQFNLIEYRGTVVTLGYRKESPDKINTHVYFIKPFYKSSSLLPQSVLKAQLGTQIIWENKILTLGLGTDLKLSKSLDYGAMINFNHRVIINAGKRFKIVLEPTNNLFAGTQRFSKSYQQKNPFLFLPGEEETVTQQVNRFKILSNEISMPIILAIGRIQFISKPAYVIPLNLLESETKPGEGGNFLHVIVGARINLLR